MQLFIKNKQTGKTETINQINPETKAWGFRFLVESELLAYKAAYEYRHSKGEVRVGFANGAGMWMVTVFSIDSGSECLYYPPMSKNDYQTHKETRQCQK